MQPTLKSVPSTFPEPPYPADTKANGYSPMVDWQVIRSSATWRLCPPEQRNNLLRLWLESWNEVPVASWEDDDQLIAAAIDMKLEEFIGYRKVLMRGWVRHSDGRLYHPFITDQALKMIEDRGKNAARQRRYRAANDKRAEDAKNHVPRDSHGTGVGQPLDNADVTGCNALLTRDSRVSNGQEGKGREENEDIGLAEANPRRANPTSTAEKPADPPTKKARDTAAAVRILDHLNAKTGRSYQSKLATGKWSASITTICNRLAEHGEDALLKVIDLKVSQWATDDKMSAFLRPETLFRASKCEQYVGELSRPGKVGPNRQERLKARWAAESASRDDGVLEGVYSHVR